MNKYKSLFYNINLKVKVLQTILKYFKMEPKNTIIELSTRNKNIVDNINEYKDNIIKVKNNRDKYSVFLRNMNFEKLYYFLSKNTVFNIYYYNVNKKYDLDKLSHKLKENIINDNCNVVIHIRLDKINEICFNKEIFNEEEARKELKKYKSINIEYIVLFILLIVGILFRILKR